MCNVLDVAWIICPRTPPQPILACSGCGTTRRFRSSGKLRLNANGKALDGWLIYRCVQCDQTWNRSILRRKKLREIEPAMLLALQASEPALVRSIEFDVPGLRQITGSVEQFSDATVRKVIRSATGRPWSQVKISLTVVQPSSLRLDRMLASQLGRSRTQIHALAASGHLRVSGGGERSLKRAVQDGTCITIALSGIEQADALAQAAMTCCSDMAQRP
jgi:hypothetical protein